MLTLSSRCIVNTLILFILFSCQKDGVNIEGYWVNANSDVLGFDYLSISGNKVILQDCLDNYQCGSLKNHNEVHFKQNSDIEVLTYELLNDSVLRFQGIDFELHNYVPGRVYIEKFDLLGLDTDFIFPPTTLDNEKWLKIKLRDSKEEYLLILGGKESKLSELLLYAPRTICSASKPKTVNYDRVIIQVEKNSSVKDLLNIEQQLYIEHRKRNFTIITDELSFNLYQAVVDHKYSSASIDSIIFEEVTSYLNVKWPPVPIPPYEKSFQDEISKINLIEVNSYFNFINYGVQDFRLDKDNLVVISTNLKIEEYLNILVWIQNLRIEKGCKVYTHFLDYI